MNSVKLSASLDGGFFFLDRIEWNNFNESTDLIPQIETYRQRHGHYPESVYIERIYRTKANRSWCKAKRIRLSGPQLGRPLKAASVNREQILQNQGVVRKDELVRIPIKGKFSQSKQRFRLVRVMTKLPATTQCTIALKFFWKPYLRQSHQLLQVARFPH